MQVRVWMIQMNLLWAGTMHRRYHAYPSLPSTPTIYILVCKTCSENLESIYVRGDLLKITNMQCNALKSQ